MREEGTIEYSGDIDKETSVKYDEPHYSADDEQQCEEFENENEVPVYTPQQLTSYKKPCPVFQDEFILDEESKKKVCIEECTTTEQSEDYPVLGDLEMLAAMLLKENQKKFSYPKDLPVPTNVEQHLEELRMRFTPSQKQEDFISTYVKGDDLLRIKVGLCEEILNDEETQKFEVWVEQLCTSTNHESLKEMARKQKVKRYLEKKHSRTYEKKVHYHIRQKVAEERLRVKGRFVTWTQALKMLNEQQDSNKSWTYNDYFKIKNLLNEKFGAIKSERSLQF
ncbi:unnamed protein product (macronuclear) [Paramecium tetraurelia]|uniref:CCT domain-containing protein n=1 Tax=Paramecium tetraurelia TaxID=5888 RepID=A0CHX3_PARTE|nr:uncharacterized protein GSPATT00038492001 [Paramecium tetraurelia]CAK70390.1 unnamed protein product [Paramecium tetraurelia]|eukprot:XP_001437787.1 hypothetical protein (macronuclear) [Paramecium tetraurelia strain d4-2]